MDLEAYESTEFICGTCMKGGICMGCMEVALEPDAILQGNGTHQPGSDSSKELSRHKSSRELLFRCLTCKRLAHYRCLPNPASLSTPPDAVVLAEHYQFTTNWLCASCFSYTYGIHKIIAWRPYPPDAIEVPLPADEPVNWKRLLPREYLIKWTDRSYKRVHWVPHMWLVSTHPGMLRNFLEGGSKVELLADAASGDDALDANSIAIPTFEIGEDDTGDLAKSEARTPALPSGPLPDAELRIPPAWKTVNRVLDALLWYPKRGDIAERRKQKAKGKKVIHLDGESDLSDLTEEEHGVNHKFEEEYAAIFEEGEQPAEDLTETLEEYEDRTGNSIQMEDINRVVWAFMKWEDLGYEEG